MGTREAHREARRLRTFGGVGVSAAASHERLGLTARLRDDLGRPSPDGPWLGEQAVVDALLELAVRGHPRGVQDVWNRVEGRPGDRPEEPPLEIDDEIAKKILAIGRDERDGPQNS
jgi:hypothetical protein